MIKAKQKMLLLWTSFRAILKKELIHISRNGLIIFLTFAFPLVDMFILGYFLDINIKQINTVIYDLAKTQESRTLVEQFVNTKDFNVVNSVNSDEELYSTIISGKAKVGIKIPVDYSEKLLDGDTVNLLVLVDGSNASVTAEAITVSNNIVLQESIKQLLPTEKKEIPIEARISVLFNPETRSANFILPGVIVFMLPSITILFSAFSIAVERERGTMEQISMTQVSPTGLVFGKMLPYGILAFAQLIMFVFFIRFIFQVPINGNIVTLLVLSIPFFTASLGIGFISAARVKTQMEVMPIAFLVRVIAPLYLSGYLFPIEGMPYIFQVFTLIVPERHYIEIVRGVILRGAGFEDLWFQTTVLSVMSIVFIGIAVILYRKKLA
ncbi:MAG: antibiotic transport system permease protein [bacterium]|nr:MAG: antibiotic transport system permease protein [bacterium]